MFYGTLRVLSFTLSPTEESESQRVEEKFATPLLALIPLPVPSNFKPERAWLSLLMSTN